MTYSHQLHHALIMMIDALDEQKTINAPAIQIGCLRIADYLVMHVKAMVKVMVKAMVIPKHLHHQLLHRVLTTMIGVRNGQQTTNVTAIKNTCLKVAKHPAVRVGALIVRNAKTRKRTATNLPNLENAY